MLDDAKVAKVRLQLSSSAAKQVASSGLISVNGLGPQYSGLFGTLFGMARNEGVKSLYGGIGPGLQRQCVFASIRIGLYEPVKDFYTKHLSMGDSASATMVVRIASGITTGAIGISFAQVELDNWLCIGAMTDFYVTHSPQMWSKCECRLRVAEPVVRCMRIRFTHIRLYTRPKASKGCGRAWVPTSLEIQWSTPQNLSATTLLKSCSLIVEFSGTDFRVISALPSQVFKQIPCLSDWV